MSKSLLLMLCWVGTALAAGAPFTVERAGAGLTLKYSGVADRSERRVCPEVEVTLPAPDATCFQVEATSSLGTGWVAYRRIGDRLAVQLPLDAGARQIHLRVVTGAPVRRGEWKLVEEPKDPAPLGSRTPVFLAHGFSSGDSLLPFDPWRNTDFDNLRAMPEYKASFAQFKYFYFTYRPWADYREVGAGFAAEIKQVLASAPAGTPLLLIGRSGGALPTRYAANDPEIAPRLLGEITLCGAMRGSVGASLLHANGHVAAKVGVPAYLMLKLTQRTYPFSPMVDSLTFDNFDGTMSAQSLADHGLMENTSLRAFNTSSTDGAKLIAYMGDVTNLWGWGDYHVKDEIYRRVLAAYDPTWGSADPLVHKPSGTLQGQPIQAIRLMPGRHHSEVLTDPALMRMFLLDLYQFHRQRQFSTLWDRATGPFHAP